MSSPDVYYYEMNGHGDIEERDTEALLTGRVPVDDPRLGALAEFVLEVGRAFPEPVIEPSMEQEHIRLMMAASAVPSQADDAEEPSRVDEDDSRPWSARLRTALKALSASLAFKIVFGAAVAAMAVAGLRAVNEAPRSEQGGFERGTGAIGTGVDDLRLLAPPQDEESEDADGADDGPRAGAPTQGTSGTDRTDSDEESDDRSEDESEDQDDESDDDSSSNDDDEHDDTPDDPADEASDTSSESEESHEDDPGAVEVDD